MFSSRITFLGSWPGVGDPSLINKITCSEIQHVLLCKKIRRSSWSRRYGIWNHNCLWYEVYSIQHCMRKFVYDLRRSVVFSWYSVSSNNNKLPPLNNCNMTLNTITLSLTLYKNNNLHSWLFYIRAMKLDDPHALTETDWLNPASWYTWMHGPTGIKRNTEEPHYRTIEIELFIQ